MVKKKRTKNTSGGERRSSRPVNLSEVAKVLMNRGMLVGIEAHNRTLGPPKKEKSNG
jgi:hypothetical protein